MAAITGEGGGGRGIADVKDTPRTALNEARRRVKQSRALSRGEKDVLRAMLEYADKYLLTGWAGKKRLAADIGVVGRTVTRHREQLLARGIIEELGYVAQARAGGKKKFTWKIHIDRIPMECIEQSAPATEDILSPLNQSHRGDKKDAKGRQNCARRGDILTPKPAIELRRTTTSSSASASNAAAHSQGGGGERADAEAERAEIGRLLRETGVDIWEALSGEGHTLAEVEAAIAMHRHAPAAYRAGRVVKTLRSGVAAETVAKRHRRESASDRHAADQAEAEREKLAEQTAREEEDERLRREFAGWWGTKSDTQRREYLRRVRTETTNFAIVRAIDRALQPERIEDQPRRTVIVALRPIMESQK